YGGGDGATSSADDEDLHLAQLSHRHQQLEVAEVARHRGAHVAGEVLVADARDGDGPDARDVDHAVAIDDRAEIHVDLAPGAHEELVAGPDDVVARDRDVLDGGESTGRFNQVEAEDL